VKRILLVLSVALIMAVMLAIAAPTFAAETGCGGDDYYFAEDFAEPGCGGDDGFLSCGEGPPGRSCLTVERHRRSRRRSRRPQ
jgi:hypothetical protein